MRSLRDLLESHLADTEMRINRPAGKRAPHIVSLTLPDIKSQTMLNHLSGKGICVSSGSACSSHDTHTSPSLLAFGLPAHEADCTLRISLSARNTEADVDSLCDALGQGIATLVRIRRK
jgi:cysteine desulfurase